MTLTTVPDKSTGDIFTEEMWDTHVKNNINDLIALAGQQNLLTNPGLEVWQRGVGPFTANLAYTADRWQISLGTSSTCSVTKETTTVDAGSVASLKAVYVHSALSSLRQKLEDVAQLRGKTVTFAARVHASVGAAVRLGIEVTGGTAAYSAYHPGGGVWQTLEVTIAVPSGATAVHVHCYLEAGVTVYLDNAVLVIGGAAPVYVPFHPEDDLGRCQRYYEVMGEGTSAYTISGIATGATQTIYLTIPYKVRKAVIPTISRTVNGTLSNTGNAFLPDVIGVDAVRGNIVSTAAGVFWNSGFVLVAEANP